MLPSLIVSEMNSFECYSNFGLSLLYRITHKSLRKADFFSPIRLSKVFIRCTVINLFIPEKLPIPMSMSLLFSSV